MDGLMPRPTTRSPAWLQRWTVQSLYTLLLVIRSSCYGHPYNSQEVSTALFHMSPQMPLIPVFSLPHSFSLFLHPLSAFYCYHSTSYQSTHTFYSISHSRRGQSVSLAYYCVILFLYLQDGFKNHVRVLGK